MFTLSPGIYKATDKDGEKITWGGENLRFVVTLDNHLKLYVGDHAKPMYTAPIIRKGFDSREEFDLELRTLAYDTILHHTFKIIDRLGDAIDLMAVIRAGKAKSGADYMSRRITPEQWEKDIRQYQDQEMMTRELIDALSAEIKRMDPTAEIIIKDL